MANNIQIPPEEWNFDSCKKENLRLCLYYELAREIPQWIKESKPYRCETANMLSWKTPFHSFVEASYLYPLLIFDEWPEQPFLKIPINDKNKKRIKEANRFLNKMHLLGDPQLMINKRSGHLLDKIHFEKNKRKLSQFIIQIDWTHSNGRLLELFEEFLKEWRQGREPLETRGATNPRDILKFLGAKRLLDRMHWKAADTLSRGLFSDQSKWIDARKKANYYISQLNQYQTLAWLKP